ncbi:MAG: hypothetical protein LBL62_12185 [Planctomycetaceae bacterium]|jgi:hypothetical protein|nr:hypothetical protein [Planctomycetaceae bacterium]
MKKDNYSADRWSEIASQIGMDNPDSENIENSEAIEKTETVVENQPEIEPDSLPSSLPNSLPNSFGKGLLDEEETTNVAENVAEEVQEVPPPTQKRDMKKSFFGRFPKINLFGNSTKESLEAVVESVKSPSLSGKSFTSSKLEKVPAFSDRTTQHGKEPTRLDTENVFPNIETSSEKTICTEEHTQAIVNILDPWSKIASQVGVLSNSQPQSWDSSDSADSAEQFSNGSAIVEADKNTEQLGNSNGNGDSNRRSRYRHDKRRSNRELPSMFDEPTPESEESAVLKNLMEPKQDGNDVEKRLRSMFNEEEKTELTTFDEVTPKRQNPNHYSNDSNNYTKNANNANNSRNSRNSNNRRETFSRRLEIDEEEQTVTVNKGRFDQSFDQNEKEESPREVVRERGRRGTRFEQREEKTERSIPNSKTDNNENRFATDSYSKNSENSENAEIIWDIDEASKPVERSGGRYRRGRSIEKKSPDRDSYSPPEETTTPFDTTLTSNEESDLVQLHKNIPSWNEAIYFLIESNITRHLQSSPPRNNTGRR